MGARILIVDDEPSILELVGGYLAREGFEVLQAASCAEAIERFIEGHPDLVVLDYQLPDGSALDVLPRLKALRPFVPVIILTGLGSIDLAVACVKEGADQFLTKPPELPGLHVSILRAIDGARLKRREAGGAQREEPDPFLGVSGAIRDLAAEARRVARAESPVLITGETGTGKGVLAAWLHRASNRAAEPMVALNCAALSHSLMESELFGHEKGAFTGAISAKPGLLEVANRGTVFLDEIGDMDLAIQPKLLKVLEEQRFRRVGEVRDRVVDVRLVAATHQDLDQKVGDGTFRSDLYFRVNTIPLHLPPLRERREDIPLVAGWILSRLQAELARPGLTLADDARDALVEHGWPGNLRELRNVLERAALLADARVLHAADLRLGGPPPSAKGAPTEHMTLEEVERAHVLRVVEACGGQVEDAARRLGLSRSALYDRLRRYGAEPSRKERPKRR